MVTIEDIVSTHGTALLSYVTRLTNDDRHAAEDIVQETWIRAWRKLDCLTEDRGSVRGWLMRVARNIVIDQYRARRARPTEVRLPERGLEYVAVHQYAVVQQCAADEVASRMDVGRILEELSPMHRDTVVEVYFADRTATNAGQTLGVPAGTVKSRVHNALRTLRSAAPHRLLEAA